MNWQINKGVFIISLLLLAGCQGSTVALVVKDSQNTVGGDYYAEEVRPAQPIRQAAAVHTHKLVIQ